MEFPGAVEANLITAGGTCELRRVDDPGSLARWLEDAASVGAILIADAGAWEALTAEDGVMRLATAAVRDRLILLPAGEQAKSWTVLEQVLLRLAALGLRRDGRLLVVGGGAACDIGALAASLYMRGVPVVLVPTTLLAMVDAAIGGKTAIDFAGVKNLVGTFHPADAVLTCPQLLRSLPAPLMRSGWAELVKASFLSGGDLLSDVEQHRAVPAPGDPGLADLIFRAGRVKVETVAADFRESGVRAHLNLGHSLGHALEAAAEGRMPHGDAVAWGMERELGLGVAMGVTDPHWHTRASQLLLRFGYSLGPTVPGDLGIGTDELLERMALDKKNRHGQIRLVLQRGAGDTLVKAIPIDVLRESITRPLG